MVTVPYSGFDRIDNVAAQMAQTCEHSSKEDKLVMAATVEGHPAKIRVISPLLNEPKFITNSWRHFIKYIMLQGKAMAFNASVAAFWLANCWDTCVNFVAVSLSHVDKSNNLPLQLIETTVAALLQTRQP